MQIPLPEGINFVREVVTNHAVSRLWAGRMHPSAVCSPKPLLHQLFLCIYLFIYFKVVRDFIQKQAEVQRRHTAKELGPLICQVFLCLFGKAVSKLLQE